MVTSFLKFFFLYIRLFSHLVMEYLLNSFLDKNKNIR